LAGLAVFNTLRDVTVFRRSPDVGVGDKRALVTECGQ
jgi:hypothetical protein